MKKSVGRGVSLCLCAALALGGLGGAASLAAGREQPAAAAPISDKIVRTEAAPLTKDETVYVLAAADGSVERIIVSDWIKNTLGSDSVRDVSDLTDVENVKGTESCTLSEDNMRVWDAGGGDIYCQGRTEKALPVELSVSYTLDGEPVSPQELAGKSGRVCIRFDYTNRQYEVVEINGQQEKIYVPFAMLTGVLLDNERFHNVEVSNGKIYNDGDRTAVIGMALPGMQDTLALDKEKLELPDYVEITADVEDFRLGNTMTLAASGLFGEVDTEKLEDTGDLSGSLAELTGAMEQLMDGSSQLYDGLCTLLEHSQQLVDGIGSLADGSQALLAGADGLETGAGRLQEGAASLSTGLSTLTASNETLGAGASQVFDSLLASANSQLAAGGVQAPELTAENYAQVLDGVIASLGESTAAGQITALKASLDSYNGFYQGLQSYTAGVAEAAAGAQGLATGAEELHTGVAGLCAGASQLNDGALALKGGAPELVEGVTRLRDGAMALSEGLVEFNEQGVQRLADAVDGDLNGLVERVRAAADAAGRYQSFTGLSEEMDGQVKFVYRTASVEAEE